VLGFFPRCDFVEIYVNLSQEWLGILESAAGSSENGGKQLAAASPASTAVPEGSLMEASSPS